MARLDACSQMSIIQGKAFWANELKCSCDPGFLCYSPQSDPVSGEWDVKSLTLLLLLLPQSWMLAIK